jgi:dynein heavy chain
MLGYYKVFTETKPLREKLVIMNKIVEEKTAELKIKKEALDRINKRIQELEDMFNEKMRQKQELEDKIRECQVKLERAQKLTDGLSEEKERWAHDIEKLNEKANLVPAHSIIAAGMISYSGPFTSQYRQKLEQSWVSGLAEQGLEHDP